MALLKDKITADLKEALKEKDKTRVLTLRLLRAAFLDSEKKKRQKIAKKEEGLSEEKLQEKSQLSDEEILEAVASEAKKRKEAIAEFERGGRKDLVKKETEELKILEKYLPEQLSNEDLKKIINETIKQVGAKEPRDIGKVMGILVPKIKGRADTGQAAQMVKEILSQK